MKIIIISDIHQPATKISQLRLEKIVELSNSLDPDIVLLLGDFMGKRHGEKMNATPSVITEKLQKLQSKFGIYAILGNHD